MPHGCWAWRAALPARTCNASSIRPACVGRSICSGWSPPPDKMRRRSGRQPRPTRAGAPLKYSLRQGWDGRQNARSIRPAEISRRWTDICCINPMASNDRWTLQHAQSARCPHTSTGRAGSSCRNKGNNREHCHQLRLVTVGCVYAWSTFLCPGVVMQENGRLPPIRCN